jgi:hypothetical protein
LISPQQALHIAPSGSAANPDWAHTQHIKIC